MFKILTKLKLKTRTKSSFPKLVINEYSNSIYFFTSYNPKEGYTGIKMVQGETGINSNIEVGTFRDDWSGPFKDYEEVLCICNQEYKDNFQ